MSTYTDFTNCWSACSMIYHIYCLKHRKSIGNLSILVYIQLKLFGRTICSISWIHCSNRNTFGHDLKSKTYVSFNFAPAFSNIHKIGTLTLKLSNIGVTKVRFIFKEAAEMKQCIALYCSLAVFLLVLVTKVNSGNKNLTEKDHTIQLTAEPSKLFWFIQVWVESKFEKKKLHQSDDQITRNPGRFAPITCSPRVVSPRKVSRFAPLNRYYIIIDEVFFDNFLVIIYLLVCKRNNNYSFWSTSVKDLKWNFSCKIYKKPHKNSKKVGFFCTNAKVHEMTKMLYTCANNLFMNELRIKC